MLVIHLLSGVFTVTSSVQFPFKVSMLLPRSPHGLITAAVSVWAHQILNFASVGLVLLAPSHKHSTPFPEKLHWLPISEHTKYKVACMWFSAIV